MRILELTNFSAGICGVFNRVREEATRLSELGHEVRIFSSDLIKGESGKIATRQDKIGKIRITRFNGKKLGGESFIKWFAGEAYSEAIKYGPDVIIAHSYRHGHTLLALKIAKKLGCKVYLVTHAPFIEKNKTRSFLSKFVVRYYDSKFGPSRKLKEFDKVIAISKWEIPILLKMGIRKEKIAYVPNGIPEEFFMQKKGKEDNKILFLGRVSPIKDLETLIIASGLIKDDRVKVEIVGPVEEEYYHKLRELINKLKLKDKVTFSKPIYELKEKIRKIDSCKVFVLPSKSEAMPQSLIEAMARGKIVVTSNNQGSRDLVENEFNGFLFKVGDYIDMAEKLNKALQGDENMKKNAKKSVERFSWDKVIKRLVEII